MSPDASRTAEGFAVRIDLIDNKPPLSANQRLYWRRKAEVTKAVRETTAWRVKSLNLPPAARLEARSKYFSIDGHDGSALRPHLNQMANPRRGERSESLPSS